MQRLCFSVLLRSQMGPRKGELLLQLDAAEVTGFLDALGSRHEIAGRVLKKNHYVVSVCMQTNTGPVDCDAVLLLKDNGLLIGGVISEWGCWPLEGTELREIPVPQEPRSGTDG